MPPTPEMTVTVLDEKLRDWCSKQHIVTPAVKIRQSKRTQGDSLVLGTYSLGVIELNIASDAIASASGQRLLHVTRALNATFLHELRHHWQYHTWDREKWRADDELPYALRKKEKDANAFADAYKTTLIFLRVKRSYGGGRLSGFGRLAAAAEGAKR